MKFITKELRAALSKPQGKLLSQKSAVSLLRKAKGTLAIVGDAAAYTLRRDGIIPNVLVYDLKTKRRPVAAAEKKFFASLSAGKISAINPPGTVTTGLFSAVRRAFASARRGKGLAKVFVKGEEDLAVIPAVLLAPLNSIVVYGQPDKGLVLMKVTAAAKKKMRGIYSRFSKKPQI